LPDDAKDRLDREVHLCFQDWWTAIQGDLSPCRSESSHVSPFVTTLIPAAPLPVTVTVTAVLVGPLSPSARPAGFELVRWLAIRFRQPHPAGNSCRVGTADGCRFGSDAAGSYRDKLLAPFKFRF
jgi:hypothetical protein